MTRLADPAAASSHPQRAQGSVALSLVRRGERNALAGLRQAGALKVLFPRPAGSGVEAVLINTAGGITGADAFSLDARAGTATRLTLTTQAAERAYRALPREVARVENRLSADAGARLCWLPQETILYDGSALSRRLRIDLAEGASLLMAEPLVFGRTAMGETLADATFRDRIEIRRNGRLAYLDAITLSGRVSEKLARPFTAAGAGAMASLVYVAPDAEAALAAVRSLLGDTAGASLRESDMLVLRLLAADGYLLRQTLIPVLNCLAGEPLPRCWTI